METVTTVVYKNDYGDERLGLKYRYNPDTNEMLKANLRFPKFSWDKDKKMWNVENNKSVIKVLCDTLDAIGGYDTSVIRDYAEVYAVDAPSRNDCWTKVKRTRMYLNWPWINDSDLRDDVRLAVKSISGSRWHSGEKSWSIPTPQATTLHGLLEDLYPPLAEAIISNEDIKEAVTKSIERVKISGAKKLDDVAQADIDSKLAGKFPEGLDLYPFQKVAVAFAEMAGGRCLIGDEMGIGKTISAIGYSALHSKARPAIVVCPSNVKFNWKKELNKWLPSESVHVVQPANEMKVQHFKDIAESLGGTGEQIRTGNNAKKFIKSKGFNPMTYIPKCDFVVVNYDVIEKFKDSLIDISPKLIILDESHYIKNSGSTNKPVQRTVATLEVCSYIEKVIALSGTAIASRPKEFFNTLNLLSPALFKSEWDFMMRYCDPYHNGYAWDFTGSSNTKELNERTRDLCIRRLKSEVLPELPPKTRTFLPIVLDKNTRSPYDSAQDEWDKKIDSYYLNGQPLPAGTMLNMINDLRHMCGHIKVNYAVDWINQYREQTGKPIVVFTHHRDVLSRLAEKMSNVKTITGDTPSHTRQEIVDDFQAGNIGVLICNTVAAKEGITLTRADTVLFLEREWTPTDEEQAEDRVYRIGQESQHVHAVYLSCEGTIDEHFDRVIESKRAVVKAVLDGGDVEQRKGLVAQLVKRLQQERGWKV